MDFEERIQAIDKFAQSWLITNLKDSAKPKDLMPFLIEQGVYDKDNKNGNPLRKDLRTLYKAGQMQRIRGLVADEKTKNIHWMIKRI